MEGKALDTRRVQLRSARTGLPAQKLKTVGCRAAASILALTLHWGNKRPHKGKGINTSWEEGHSHY